ncbi:MAG TPA: alpha/beta fold hydrolase [Pyrinomonadaceae bacterium]|nr:alpha/beta fold hydrolase [Pyrinomonadaceae bacterium]
MSHTITPTVFYRRLNIEGLEIFYREAGPRDAPTLILLHGFPSSSHMFRNLIPTLANKYHVVAPDLPGYGESSAPSVNDFDYSFDRLANVTEQFTEKLNLSSYALYLSDIGASVGFRLAVMHPERVTAMIVQNGGGHVEALNKEFSKGLFDYWENRSEKNAQVLLDWLLTIEGTKWHYLHGVSDPSRISPDNWVIDQAYQDRPGNKEVQLSILYNAKRDLDVFADWQKYFREQQPPTLITWGKNDGIFTVEGAELFKRDIPGAEVHLLDTGHFALEEEVNRIGSLMHEFLDRTFTFGFAAALTHAQQVNTLLTKPLPEAPGKEIEVITVNYAPGAVDAIHRHDAHAVVYVLEGAIEMQVRGGTLQRLGPGQVFYESPEDVHTVSRNASKTKPAKFVVFFIKTEGAPILTPVH